MKTEKLQFRDISYPQLSRLPKGTRTVKQDGWQYTGTKYAFFTKKRILMPLHTKSLKLARKRALAELNEAIRWVALVYENPTMEQFKNVYS
jgi:hypothetical protein